MIKKNILICAYSCSPYRGSDAGIGWNNAIQMAKYYNVWAIVREEKFKDEITKYIKDNGQIDSLNFIFFPHSKFEDFIMKYSLFFYKGYNLWHKRLLSLAKELHKEHSFVFALMHTFEGFREPGYLWKLPVPFFWGPVGGVQNYPNSYLLSAGLKGFSKELFRNIANELQLRFSLHVRNAIKHCKVFLGSNSLTVKRFQAIYKIKPVLVADIGLNKISTTVKSFEKMSVIKILWSGVFEHRKALHLLLHALSKMPSSVPFELHVLGNGEMDSKWKALCSTLGLDSKVKWLGWLPHEKALEEFTWCDIFVFTSLRDTSGTVILEAISQGIPVITLDHQGAADIIDSSCGIKIPLSNFNTTVCQLSDAITSLYNNSDTLKELSKGALKRSEMYLWEKKVRYVHQLFEQALQSKNLN